ncbi:MAG: STT3 domain-containing protein [Candidatus Diapherotrites archaeon]|nr:STT3 domain-containing protein [Candidatus Diapherotrites archaeon]MDZ4256051.1 STT3 domain-containing protein [archaeon]
MEMDSAPHPESPPSPVPEESSKKESHFTKWKEKVSHLLWRKEFLFILLVFILGFIVRAQLMRYELFFEFDSYWHARMVSYILQGLPAPMIDPLGYYQNVAAATLGNVPLLFWYISAAIYKIFTFNAPYDFEVWVLFIKILPALYGALIAVAMYFLGKELFKGSHEKAAGLLTGILAAVIPAFVYRTMGGFFEDDSLGFIWMVIGFVFLVRAVREPEWKRSNITDALLAGISFSLMVFTWSAFNMLIPILLGVGFVQFLLWVREDELEKAKHYAGLWLVAFILLAISATIQTNLGWLDQFGGILGVILKNPTLGYADTILVILGMAILSAGLWFTKKRMEWGGTVVKWLYILIILALILSPLLVTMFNFSLQTGDVLGQTVGEESEGKNYFGNKYSFLVLFAIIGIPAIGYLLLRRSRHFEFLVIPLIWLLVTFFMAWGKLKFTYYWGLPLALMGAVVMMLGWRWVSHKSIRRKKMVTAAMGFMIVLSVGIGTLFVTQNVPNIELSPGWKTALFWADENLPGETKFFNWWDEGHWISFLANRKVIIDNRNADTKATSDVARFILARDVDQANAIVANYGSTHLIFGDDLLGKLPNLGFYAYGVTNINDPRIQGVLGFVMNCSREETVLTKEVNYNCGGNQFSEAQMNATPTTWTSNPNQTNRDPPLFMYRDFDNRKVYFFSRAANESMLVRLWFGEASVQSHYTEVYRNAGGVRIYSIDESPLDTTA